MIRFGKNNNIINILQDPKNACCKFTGGKNVHLQVTSK